MRLYLETIRKKNNLSQLEVAERLGITQQMYSAVENGNRQKSMDLKTMSGLAEVFNVSIEYIVQQEQEMEQRR